MLLKEDNDFIEGIARFCYFLFGKLGFVSEKTKDESISMFKNLAERYFTASGMIHPKIEFKSMYNTAKQEE